ncbi:MAG TPA: N-acetylmuramoyl-L-alanine amidase, partial [Flavisolibacter sp.]|nr:N-acetylmuramoyl-L-alanine amidase [Flavisolibacter sp.]
MKRLLLLVTVLCCLHGSAQTVRYARTTGLLPYLEYGPGDDRLGGAKMTYLDTNIFMRVADSTTDDYKVQLSQQHFAFVPKVNMKPDTATVHKPYYLTGSWKVYGDDNYDYVTVALPERLPYKSTQELSPSKLIVDIYGATSNTNWITQLKTGKEIKNVWQEQIEDDVFRIHIELVHAQHWGHAIYYNNNALVIRVKRQPPLKLKGLRVAVDAGHGGTNAGASGITTNIAEKEYTLRIAKKLEDYLVRKGAKVFMTRTGDTDLTMIDRTLMLRKEDPHVLLSIHLNSSSNTTVSGTSTYYRHIGFRSLSVAILNEMLQ